MTDTTVTGAPSASPYPKDLNESRRRLLRLGAIGGGALAATLVAGVASATPAADATQISGELVKRLREFDRALRASERFDVDVHDPAWERFKAARDAVPHVEFDGPYGYDGGPGIWSTGQEHRVRHARWAVRQKVSFWGPGGDAGLRAHKAQRKLVAAVLWRERAVARIRRHHGFDAIADESDRLSERVQVATQAVTGFAVANLADLHAKLDFMTEHGQFDTDGAVELICRDVANLQATEAGHA